MIADINSKPNEQLTFTYDDRHWRVRGLERQLSCERMKVNLLVARRELVHVDTLDLYAARMRRMFIKEAAAELYIEEATLKQDLGRVLCELESRQETLIRQTLAQYEPETPLMSSAERDDALQLLKDPELLSRILADYDACGLVGEETNKLVCYLACVSRHLPRPLSVLIQSSSAAGKTSLLEATLAFMPAEAQLRLSALTGQSLYYMGRTQLKHKILALAEEEGVTEAAYALKLLQSEGRLAIASAGKDGDTGRQQTQHYEVEGPVAMLLTTTAEEPDAELLNRCLRLSVNEQPTQTAAIHQRQRAAYTLQGIPGDAQAVRQRHQHAQRLLEPLGVVIPWAEQLTFRSDQTRMRRDHAKYLALIAASALLHQYQRKQVTRVHGGQAQQCVVASGDDLRTANRLASEILSTRFDALLPQTRQLLEALDQYVNQRSRAEGTPRVETRFTQRQLRETLGWCDRALRRQLRRLIELEYVLVYPTGRGNQRAYQLLYDGQTADGAPLLLGLTDVERLSRDQRAEVRDQRAEVRDQRAECGSAGTEEVESPECEVASNGERSRERLVALPGPSASPPIGTESAPCPSNRHRTGTRIGTHPAACQNEVKPRNGKGFRGKPAL